MSYITDVHTNKIYMCFFYLQKEINLKTEEMVEPINCLPCNPQPPHEKADYRCICMWFQGWGNWERRVPEACCPGNLASFSSPTVSEIACLKNIRWRVIEEDPWCQPIISKHMYTCTDIPVYTQRIKLSLCYSLWKSMSNYISSQWSDWQMKHAEEWW